MKKSFLKLSILFGAAIAFFSSCSNSSSTAASASSDIAPATPLGKAITIAYVQMDSITLNYQYAIDIRAKLQKDAEDSRAQLTSKANAFQTAAQDFQRKAQINAFVSDQAAQQAQQKVMKMQQEVQQLEMQLQQTLAQKEMLLTSDMGKDISDKIKEFNKDGKYTLILNSVSMTPVLYADKSMDITAEFLAFLNESYKSSTGKIDAALDTTKTAEKK